MAGFDHAIVQDQVMSSMADVETVRRRPNPLEHGPGSLSAGLLELLFDSALRNTPFRVVRAELFAKTGLEIYAAYADWDDFQARNDLPDGLIQNLKAAYPDGFDAMDAWVGILAECQATGGAKLP